MAKKTKTMTNDPPWNGLYLLSCKVRGLGELLKGSKPEALFTEDAAFGLGALMIELADEASSILQAIEDQRP